MVNDKTRRTLKYDGPPESGISFSGIIGRSARMREIFSKINSIADKDISVLIGGESGTGKELVAQALHGLSRRSGSPFVKVNCAAIPDTLIESELFGHEKGSFTGAFERKTGKFELADHGTLFLDEIGDMALTTQSKVLRVIQEREFERIGSVRPIKVDVRLITATHRDLVAEVNEKRFREDLFFRLNVVSLLLPPLRERKEDIPLLCEFFINKFEKKFNKPKKNLSSEVVEAFLNYRWPGNIRELQNIIESAVAMEEGDIITLESLPYRISGGEPRSYGRRKTDRTDHIAFEKPAQPGIMPDKNPEPADVSGAAAFKHEPARAAETSVERAVDAIINSMTPLDKIEELLIIAALKKANGRQIDAAALLGIQKGEMQYKLKKYNIKISEYKIKKHGPE